MSEEDFDKDIFKLIIISIFLSAQLYIIFRKHPSPSFLFIFTVKYLLFFSWYLSLMLVISISLPLSPSFSLHIPLPIQLFLSTSIYLSLSLSLSLSFSLSLSLSLSFSPSQMDSTGGPLMLMQDVPVAFSQVTTHNHSHPVLPPIGDPVRYRQYTSRTLLPLRGIFLMILLLAL